MKHLLYLTCSALLVVLFAAFSAQETPKPGAIKSHAPGDAGQFMSALTAQYDSVRMAIDEAKLQADAKKAGEIVSKAMKSAHKSLTAGFPVYYDWWLQDGDFNGRRLKENLGYDQYGQTPGIDWFRRSLEEEIELRLSKIAEHTGKTPSAETAGEQLSEYLALCVERREQRLARFVKATPRMLFTKFEVLRPSFFAYTEGLSDARCEANFFPGSELSLLNMKGIWAEEETLMADAKGVFRDPDLNYDGRNLLFSWKKSTYEDDFHIYEMDLTSRKVTQLTEGKGYADIEPVYLPDGNILFNSTRCGTSVDCWMTEVSNLYLCDGKGDYIRRVGYDQVHTVRPTVLDDGRVVYTRWDYNDRGQIYTQPLFQMNPDGTAQAEYYGLNSWFPTTATQVRQIPGTRKVMATIIGHHTPAHGKLGIIDPEAGRDEDEGVMMVAPYERAEPVRLDKYGQYGDQFQHPYPLNDTEFLISYSPLGYYVGQPINFGIYWMDIDGHRELLASDASISCNMPIVVAPRKRPFVRASHVDYAKNTGTYYLQNIYEGGGLEGIEKGKVKQLRIVELVYRSAGIGSVVSDGPGGRGGDYSTPSVGNGSWDLKKVHGVVDVNEDGSAFFEVPARAPLYFQALDENGFVIQTMRSWSTLMPGEMQSCVGCHEHKNSVPVFNHPVSAAMAKPVQKITPPEGGVRNINFIADVQPILDRSCVSCHDGNRHPMSLKGDLKVFDDRSKRKFSDAYMNLTHARAIPANKVTYKIVALESLIPVEENSDGVRGTENHPEVNWISSVSEPTLLKPYSAGAATSNLITRLKNGHGGVSLSEAEIARIALWIDLCVPFIGDYREANDWTPEDAALYDYHDAKRRKAEAEDAAAIKGLASKQTQK